MLLFGIAIDAMSFMLSKNTVFYSLLILYILYLSCVSIFKTLGAQYVVVKTDLSSQCQIIIRTVPLLSLLRSL